MSQPPQPPRWGDPVPPGAVPPPAYPQQHPPPAYPQQWAPVPEQAAVKPGLSDKAKFWIGFLLILPASVVFGAATAVVTSAFVEDAGGTANTVVALVSVVGVVAGIVVEKTRWFAVGLLTGAVVLTVLALIAVFVIVAMFVSIFN